MTWWPLHFFFFSNDVEFNKLILAKKLAVVQYAECLAGNMEVCVLVTLMLTYEVNASQSGLVSRLAKWDHLKLTEIL